MSEENSVSQWLDDMKKGDDHAAAQLWDRYYRRLVGLARKRLRDIPRRASDEEDVALSAFNDFCRAVRDDARYVGLSGRNDLWRVLVRFTVNKIRTHTTKELAEKRGGGRVQGESELEGPDDSSSAQIGLDRWESSEADPALMVELDEKFDRFFTLLNDREAEVAALRLEGYGNDEIAVMIGLSPATVKRVMAVVRETMAEVFEVAKTM